MGINFTLLHFVGGFCLYKMRSILVLLALVGICCAQTRTQRLVPSTNPFEAARFNQFGQNSKDVFSGRYNPGRYAVEGQAGRYRPDNSGRYIDDGRYVHDNSGRYIHDNTGNYKGEGIGSSRYSGGGGQYAGDFGRYTGTKDPSGKDGRIIDTQFDYGSGSGIGGGFSGKDTGIGTGYDSSFGKIKSIGSGSNTQGLGSRVQSAPSSSTRSNVGIGSGSNVGSLGVGKSPLEQSRVVGTSTGSNYRSGIGSGIQVGTSSGLSSGIGTKDGFGTGTNTNIKTGPGTGASTKSRINEGPRSETKLGTKTGSGFGSATGTYPDTKSPGLTTIPLKQIETVKPIVSAVNVKSSSGVRISGIGLTNTGINRDLSGSGAKTLVNVGSFPKDGLAGAAQNQFGKTVLPPGSGFGNTGSATSNTGKFIENGWKILRQENEADEDGYHYLYDTENRISVEERGKLHNKGTDKEAMRAVGFFQFTGPDNQIYKVTYTSDENGFVPEGAHLPTPPPIPDYILKSLDYQRSLGLL